MTTQRIIHYLTIIFSVIWTFLILVDYYFFHPQYLRSIQLFQYSGLVTILTLLGLGLGYLMTKILGPSKKPFFLYNGVGVLLLLSLICCIIIPMHFNNLGPSISINFGEVLLYVGKILLVILSTFFIYMVCYCAGSFLLDNLFDIRLQKLERGLVSIALGILVTCLLVYLLASFGIISPILVTVLFVLTAVAFWKRAWQFFQSVFLTPFSGHKNLGWLGFGSFYFLLIWIGLVQLQNIRPVPFGFDALGVYLNLPKLLYEKQQLIEGYSPYYWSLFNSLGYYIFRHIEVVISISVTGGILSAIALFQLAKRWLSVDYALLTSLLFCSLPMVNFQFFKDVKIDLGLLFILMCVILIVFDYINYLFPEILKSKSSKKKRGVKEEIAIPEKVSISKKRLLSFFPKDIQYFILLGLLSGLALGIKLTSLILIFSVVVTMFFIKTGIIGFITSISLTLFFILIAGLDVATGLRAYHFGVSWFKWIPLLVGILGIGYLLYAKLGDVLQLVKLCAIYGFFTLLVYMPWPIKNYSETKSASFDTFIRGREYRPNGIN